MKTSKKILTLLSILVLIINFSFNSEGQCGLRNYSALTSITFVEVTSSYVPITMMKNDPKLLTNLPNPLTTANSDFNGVPNSEAYDVFYSDANGAFDSNGCYITIQATYSGTFAGGGLNISSVSLDFGSTKYYVNAVKSFIGNGSNFVSSSVSNIIGNNNNTAYTSMGNTSSPSIPRLSITIGFNLPNNIPTISSTLNSVCPGSCVVLSVNGSLKCQNSYWQWYKDGCGIGATPLGTNVNTITVCPTNTTTYFVREEGGCDTVACGSTIINVVQSVSPPTYHTTTISMPQGGYTWACNGVTYANCGNYTCTSTNPNCSIHTETLILVCDTCISWLLGGNSPSDCENSQVTPTNNILGINYPSGSPLRIFTEGSEKIRVDVNGNVGIGITSPTQKLHVHEGSILLTGQNPSGGPMILFGDKTPPPFAHPHGNWGIEYEDGAGGLNFWRPFMSAGGFENFLLFLKDNGNIGINNSNPGNRLVITKGVPDQSGLRLTNLTSASPAVAPATSNVLSVDANGDVILVPCCSNSNTNYWSRNTTTGTIYPTNTASLGDKLALGTSSVLTTNPYLYPGGFNARLKLNGGDLVIQEDSINNVGSPDQGADVYLIDKNGNGLDIGAQNGNAELIAYGANTSLKFSTPGAPQGIIMHGDGTNKGKVQIGNVTTPGNYLLYVEKGIMAEKVKVAVKTSAQWADHVLSSQYQLMPLGEVENYIQSNSHLPGIPAAKELVNDGLDLGEMQAKQMAKIEELTLYLLEIKNRLDVLQKENEVLRSSHKN